MDGALKRPGTAPRHLVPKMQSPLSHSESPAAPVQLRADEGCSALRAPQTEGNPLAGLARKSLGNQSARDFRISLGLALFALDMSLSKLPPCRLLVVRVAEHAEVLDSGRPAPRVRVAVIQREEAFLAAASPDLVDEGALVAVSDPHLASHVDRHVT